MSLDEKFEVPIKCPKCDQVTKKSLRELKLSTGIVCSGCGAIVDVPSESADAAASAGDALGGVQAAFDALKKLSRER